MRRGWGGGGVLLENNLQEKLLGRFSGSSKSSSPCDQRSMPEGSLGGLLALTLSLDQTNGDKSGDTCRQSTEHSSNGDSSGDTCRLATGHFPSRTPSSGR